MIHPDGELLSAYLDGEVETAEAATVTAHIATCDLCRSDLADLDEARSAVRSLPMIDPGLEELTTAELAAVISIDQTRPKRPFRWAAGTVAAAAALVVALGVFGGSSDPTVDFGSVADQHTARASVDPGVNAVRAVTAVNDP